MVPKQSSVKHECGTVWCEMLLAACCGTVWCELLLAACSGTVWSELLLAACSLFMLWYVHNDYLDI